MKKQGSQATSVVPDTPHSLESCLEAAWGLCGRSSVDSSMQHTLVADVPKETCFWCLRVVPW